MGNQNAIVTGGSRGIGESVCENLALKGCNILFTYKSSEDKAKEVESYLKEKYNVEVFAVRCDVTDFEQVKDLEKILKKTWKKIDIVINNVGTTGDMKLFMMSNLDQWNETLISNINPVINLTKIVIPKMISNKSGRIINITSLGGITGNPGYSAYATAKAGIYAFTKSVQKELAQFNILFNCVAPGLIDTKMTRDVKKDYESKRLENSVLKRKGTAEEVANLIGYLACDAPDYLVNQEILIDGGVRG